MPDITHQVNCNLQWKQRQTIYAKQGEYGARKIKLFLYNGSNNYDVPASGISASGLVSGPRNHRRPGSRRSAPHPAPPAG